MFKQLKSNLRANFNGLFVRCHADLVISLIVFYCGLVFRIVT